MIYVYPVKRHTTGFITVLKKLITSRFEKRTPKMKKSSKELIRSDFEPVDEGGEKRRMEEQIEFLKQKTPLKPATKELFRKALKGLDPEEFKNAPVPCDLCRAHGVEGRTAEWVSKDPALGDIGLWVDYPHYVYLCDQCYQNAIKTEADNRNTEPSNAEPEKEIRKKLEITCGILAAIIALIFMILIITVIYRTVS